MSEVHDILLPPLDNAAAPGLAAKLLRRVAANMQHGRLVLVTPSRDVVAHRGTKPGPEAVIELRNWRPLRAYILGGDTGFADSYIAGDWSTPDLAAMLQWGALNGLETTRTPWLLTALRRWRHARNKNSKAGSRRNIAFHYDLGNDFYARWLSAEMFYSAAIYEAPDETLEAAQARKLSRILDLLDLAPGQNLLEIGCGWGTMAEAVARQGASVTALTLSAAQHEYTTKRLAEAGLAHRATAQLRDYRDETGSYDRIVSIEMLEAVGENYWPVYFAALRARLKQGGKAVLQAITISAARFENYRATPDFIQTHIFPGGMLPTTAHIAQHAQAAGLKLAQSTHFGLGYAQTLAAWRQRFQAAWPDIESETFPPAFKRLWDYYLCYCEAGFRTGMVDCGLYVLQG